MSQESRRLMARLTSRMLVRLVFLVLVPLAAILLSLRWYAQSGREQETENAYVKADIVAVSAEVSGRVVEVAVHDNELIEAGKLLFRVDPQPFENAVSKAQAQMDAVRSEVQSLRAEYRSTLLETEEARMNIAFLTKQFERQEQLKERGMSRLDAYDEARHNLEVARRRIEGARERTNRITASLLGDPSLPVERFPRYLEAQTAHAAASTELGRTFVRAPVAGVVSNMRLQVGEHAEKGVPMFSLISNSKVWIEANYKETQLTNMRVGQRAKVIADAYPDSVWPARVSTIAPATGAEFAVLPPQNATGNWVKVVQRVPVLIDVDRPDGYPQLRAGMTVTVAVDTGHSNGLPRFIQSWVDKGYLPRSLQSLSAGQ
jgi:membrane fusion protein (multidrug efflux system)